MRTSEIHEGAPIMEHRQRLVSSTPADILHEEFQKEYAGEIKALYDEFITRRAFTQIEKVLPNFMNMKVDALHLSPHIPAYLKLVGIIYVHELMLYSEEDLQRFPGIGKKASQKISEALKEAGLISGS